MIVMKAMNHVRQVAPRAVRAPQHSMVWSSLIITDENRGRSMARRLQWSYCFSIFGLISALVFAGCAPQHKPRKQVQTSDPMAILLVSHSGASKLDFEIRRLQDQVRVG